MVKFLATTKIPSSFLSGTQTSIQNTPQDSHPAGIMKLCNHMTPSAQKEKKREIKSQALPDSVLTLKARRHYRCSYLAQNLKRKCREEREGEKSGIHHNIITLRRVILVHPDLVQVQ